MSEFNFKSSVCTSKEQSERLLALGLKKETADMCYQIAYLDCGLLKECSSSLIPHNIIDGDRFIPAWSLHRLLSMLPDNAPKIYWVLDGASISIDFEDDCSTFFPHKGDIYEGVVNCIEWLIKEGYFKKEYLV